MTLNLHIDNITCKAYGLSESNMKDIFVETVLGKYIDRDTGYLSLDIFKTIHC